MATLAKEGVAAAGKRDELADSLADLFTNVSLMVRGELQVRSPPPPRFRHIVRRLLLYYCTIELRRRANSIPRCTRAISYQLI
jgi:hypothetical protein